MANPLKVAYIIDTIETPSAGTEKQLLMLLSTLDRSRVMPHLVCLRNSSWMSEQRFEFPVSVIGLGGLFSTQFFGAVRKFKNLHKQEKFDLVQTFFVDANIFGTYAARRCRIPIIISSRRNIGYWHNQTHVRILRYLRRWTTNYLANSLAAKQSTVDIEGADPDTIDVIYNGLDLDKFATFDSAGRERIRREWEVEDDEILIGIVANLRGVKNIHSVVDAAARLNKRFANLKFVVVGEGNLRNELLGKIYTNALTGKFKMPGRYENIIPCLAAFDIAVLPSESESFSNSLIEYMASGLPIVATDVGGAREAVKHDESALLYSPGDVEALADCLMRIIENRQLADTIRKNARRIAFENYHMDRIVEAHTEYYLRLHRKSVSNRS